MQIRIEGRSYKLYAQVGARFRQQVLPAGSPACGWQAGIYLDRL